LKIATYNVNGINGRLPVLLRWLKQDHPDVVCLQELKCSDDRFPERELQEAGYAAVWCVSACKFDPVRRGIGVQL